MKGEAKKTSKTSALAETEAQMAINLHRDCKKKGCDTNSTEMNVILAVSRGGARTSQLRNIVRLVMRKRKHIFPLSLSQKRLNGIRQSLNKHIRTKTLASCENCWPKTFKFGKELKIPGVIICDMKSLFAS